CFALFIRGVQLAEGGKVGVKSCVGRWRAENRNFFVQTFCYGKGYGSLDLRESQLATRGAVCVTFPQGVRSGADVVQFTSVCADLIDAVHFTATETLEEKEVISVNSSAC